MSAGPFADRRARVLAQLGAHDALLLAALPELRAGDAELRYHVDPDLFYLAGCQEPDAVLLLAPGAEARFTLLVRPRDAERELWTGARGGPEAAREGFGADAAFASTELATRLPAMLEQVDRLFYRFGASPWLDRLVQEQLAAGRARRPRHGHGLHTVVDPGLLLDELRLRKDAGEQAAIRADCAIAVAAYGELPAAIRPGVGEWVLEALLEAGFRRRGAEGPSFPTIVGSGANATVLHYTANSGVLAAGQVVLVDAGARADRYCSDITRCYPVAGRFTPAQQALFDVVKEAHDAAVAAAVAGAPVSGLHDAAVRVLVAGMVELRLLQGDPTALLGEPERWKRFYPHRTSHWLGLEVHDAGTYTDGENPRLLEPGMVLTVEPGLYVPVDATGAPAELRGTGIRLEDDVLVTSGAPEVLTAALPLQP